VSTTEAVSSGFAFSITLSITVPMADGIAFAILAAGTGSLGADGGGLGLLG
jgi:hypothetical protein